MQIGALLTAVGWALDHTPVSDAVKNWGGGFVMALGVVCTIVSGILNEYDRMNPDQQRLVDAVGLHALVNNAMADMQARFNEAFGGDANNGGGLAAGIRAAAEAALPGDAVAIDIHND